MRGGQKTPGKLDYRSEAFKAFWHEYQLSRFGTEKPMAKVDTHYRLRDAIERRRFRSRQQVFAYRQWPNLVEYLVVESVAHRLELYRRELDCWWLTITEVATQPLRLEGIGQDLRVTEAFEDLLT